MTAEWPAQQLREAFPEPCRYRYLILDRDRKFDGEVVDFLRSAGWKVKRASVRAPWQNGLAERWIGSCRREILDHVIALNEEHLRRIMADYTNYHHEDRLHDSLGKDTPNQREVEQRPGVNAQVISIPRLGGAPPSVHVAPGGIGNPPNSRLRWKCSRKGRNLPL